MPLNQTSCLFQRVCSVLLSLQLEVSTVEKGGRKSVPGCVLGFPGREGAMGSCSQTFHRHCSQSSTLAGLRGAWDVTFMLY